MCCLWCAVLSIKSSNLTLRWTNDKLVTLTNSKTSNFIIYFEEKFYLSYVFWSDLGDTPRIERLDLKTDDRRVLLSSSPLRRPTKLAIDVANQRLFWLDASAAAIGSMDFDGSGVSQWTLSAFSTVSSFALYQVKTASIEVVIVPLLNRQENAIIILKSSSHIPCERAIILRTPRYFATDWSICNLKLSSENYLFNRIRENEGGSRKISSLFVCRITYLWGVQ